MQGRFSRDRLTAVVPFAETNRWVFSPGQPWNLGDPKHHVVQCRAVRSGATTRGRVAMCRTLAIVPCLSIRDLSSIYMDVSPSDLGSKGLTSAPTASNQ